MKIPRPEADRFYEPVETDGMRPGHLFRMRQVEVQTGVESSACQVVYSSIGVRGETIPVSGTILQPLADWTGPGTRPIVSYGVLARGLTRNAAPSYAMRRGIEFELPLIELALSQGWSVAVTDGVGLGMPGPHSYCAGRPGGHAMLDIVRAISRTDLVGNDAPVLLWGYSEGGRYATWAAELQPTYAPELNVRAIAAGGVPADLYQVAKALDGGPFSAINLAVTVGLIHAYGSSVLGHVLNKQGHAAAAHAKTLDIAALIRAYPQELRHHMHCDDAWDTPMWRSLLARERHGRVKPDAAVFLYHANNDAVVPVQQARELYDRYVALGADVTWSTTPAEDHFTGTFQAGPAAVCWLKQQLD
ncbi:lipase family protein [Mycobacterium simiae]|uniref:lipase family protein n=1 Tax=Mycobacterium simiae TaxID=1784 RepID=UPI00261F052F|nr:lipase family protein [Mycobacterium simiae]